MTTSSFSAVYAEWLHARAALVQLDAEEDFSEARGETVANAKEVADWKLLQTPAGDLVDIQDRARVVLQMFSDTDANGEYSDSRHRLMLAALVSEILNYWPRLAEKIAA